MAEGTSGTMPPREPREIHVVWNEDGHPVMYGPRPFISSYGGSTPMVEKSHLIEAVQLLERARVGMIELGSGLRAAEIGAGIDRLSAATVVGDIWQPIETAPRNRRVLVWTSRALVAAYEDWGGRFGWFNDDGREVVPSKWSPLPDGPDATSEEADRLRGLAANERDAGNEEAARNLEDRADEEDAS